MSDKGQAVHSHIEHNEHAQHHTTHAHATRWPSRGEVEVKGLMVRYRADLDPVLRDLSFHVPPRTKVSDGFVCCDVSIAGVDRWDGGLYTTGIGSSPRLIRTYIYAYKYE